MKTGVPVSITWSQGTLKGSWVGYVSYITKNVAGQIENLMEVQCVGTTFVLKERATKVFTNITIPQAVEKIVKSFGFRFIGESHPRVFEQLTMAGHSYWEWIQEQAKRIGYGVVVNGMDFYFRPLDELFKQGQATVPILSISGTAAGVGSEFYDRTLDSFKVLSGDHIEEGEHLRTVKKVGGVNPITGQAITASKSPKNVGKKMHDNLSDVLFNELRSDQVVSNPADAASVAAGAAHMGRLNLPAKIKCQGDPRIRPFGPIYIDGTGAMTDGYWMAKEVKHMIAFAGDYYIEMTASTDGLNPDLANSEPAKKIPGSVVGVVNLEEAMSGKASQLSSISSRNARLVTPNPIYSQTNQGFHRTGSRWTYSSVGG
jgi:phage protein D